MKYTKMRISLIAVAGIAIILAATLSATNASTSVSDRCPAKLKAFCGDWRVNRADVVHDITGKSKGKNKDHLDLNDRFRISALGFGAEPPIWLEAKPTLKTRWNQQEAIKLREIERNGKVECLVGRIELPHDLKTEKHTWHQITLAPPKAVGGNTELQMCLTKRDHGDWPNKCRMQCDSKSSLRIFHGGRAHAQND